eukprot:1161182-Pelagomonas_calceolata.AAC.17
MAQRHEVDVSGRTLNAKKEHIWGFAQIAPSENLREKFRAQLTALCKAAFFLRVLCLLLNKGLPLNGFNIVFRLWKWFRGGQKSVTKEQTGVPG